MVKVKDKENLKVRVKVELRVK